MRSTPATEGLGVTGKLISAFRCPISFLAYSKRGACSIGPLPGVLGAQNAHRRASDGHRGFGSWRRSNDPRSAGGSRRTADKRRRTMTSWRNRRAHPAGIRVAGQVHDLRDQSQILGKHHHYYPTIKTRESQPLRLGFKENRQQLLATDGPCASVVLGGSCWIAFFSTFTPHYQPS